MCVPEGDQRRRGRGPSPARKRGSFPARAQRVLDRCSATAASFLLVARAGLASDSNSLTDDEKRTGFECLFNGRDFQGWEAPEICKVTEGFCTVREGAIDFPKDNVSPPLPYRKTIPPDFELRFQWKPGPSEEPGLSGHFSIGTYGAAGQDGWRGTLFCAHCAGDVQIRFVTGPVKIPLGVAGVTCSKTPSSDAVRPRGNWNDARILYKGSRLEHWLNGDKIVDIDLRKESWVPTRSPLKRWIGSLMSGSS